MIYHIATLHSTALCAVVSNVTFDERHVIRDSRCSPLARLSSTTTFSPSSCSSFTSCFPFYLSPPFTYTFLPLPLSSLSLSEIAVQFSVFTIHLSLISLLMRNLLLAIFYSFFSIFSTPHSFIPSCVSHSLLLSSLFHDCQLLVQALRDVSIGVSRSLLSAAHCSASITSLA